MLELFLVGMAALLGLALLALGILLCRAMRYLYARRIEHNWRQHVLHMIKSTSPRGGKKAMEDEDGNDEIIGISTVIVHSKLGSEKPMADCEDRKMEKPSWPFEGPGGFAFQFQLPPAYSKQEESQQRRNEPPPEYSSSQSGGEKF